MPSIQTYRQAHGHGHAHKYNIEIHFHFLQMIKNINIKNIHMNI